MGQEQRKAREREVLLKGVNEGLEEEPLYSVTPAGRGPHCGQENTCSCGVQT